MTAHRTLIQNLCEYHSPVHKASFGILQATIGTPLNFPKKYDFNDFLDVLYFAQKTISEDTLKTNCCVNNRTSFASKLPTEA